MDLNVVIERLRGTLLPEKFEAVERAKALNPLIEEYKDQCRLPLALVQNWQAHGGETHSFSANYVRQTTHEQFGVVIVCSEDEIDRRRGDIQSVLIGCQLDGYQHLATYIGGAMLELKATLCAWREIYQVQVDRTNRS